jgi:hypothetical protein
MLRCPNVSENRKESEMKFSSWASSLAQYPTTLPPTAFVTERQDTG